EGLPRKSMAGTHEHKPGRNVHSRLRHTYESVALSSVAAPLPHQSVERPLPAKQYLSATMVDAASIPSDSHQHLRVVRKICRHRLHADASPPCSRVTLMRACRDAFLNTR